MSIIDWLVLILSMLGIVLYGMYKGRGSNDMRSYFASNKSIKWYTIGLSIMATQASAITFLSAPGQAYTDGMRFIQFYFGLPIAMVIISYTIVPIYKKLNVLTAYEYLGKRFDLKTRVFGAFLFLVQRGLAAGFTIYAPALVLSTILGWNIYLTNLIIGVLVIIYTVAGGTKAVSHTHKLQMIVILSGMALAGFLVVWNLPTDISFVDALHVAGKMDKLNVIDWEFNPDSKYNVWSGLLGGLFLMLSYFGTDQSQVQRYLGDQSEAQSKVGLLFNGLVKIPMQFLILLIGALVFVFYQFASPPIYFNETSKSKVYQTEDSAQMVSYEQQYAHLYDLKDDEIKSMLQAKDEPEGMPYQISKAKVQHLQKEADELKKTAVKLINKHDPTAEKSDVNYVFLSFVLKYFPVGVVGLLLACILFASMSSTSSELNALASTTMIDIYKRNIKKDASDKHYLIMSKVLTAGWGVYAILFAFFAGELGSLIEAVNILGSLFYGTILGIFVVGFYLKHIKSNAVFWGAVISEVFICIIYYYEWMAYLWLPLVGCCLVVIISIWLNRLLPEKLKGRMGEDEVLAID